MPTNAMLFVGIFNIFLTAIIEFSAFILELSTTSMTLLTASALGYAIANFVCLLAFVKTRTQPRFKDFERPFKAPKAWTYVIPIFVAIQLVWFFSLMYWSYIQSGNSPIAIVIGIIILCVFIPIWMFTQKKNAATE